MTSKNKREHLRSESRTYLHHRFVLKAGACVRGRCSCRGEHSSPHRINAAPRSAPRRLGTRGRPCASPAAPAPAHTDPPGQLSCVAAARRSLPTGPSAPGGGPEGGGRCAGLGLPVAMGPAAALPPPHRSAPGCGSRAPAAGPEGGFPRGLAAYSREGDGRPRGVRADF